MLVFCIPWQSTYSFFNWFKPLWFQRPLCSAYTTHGCYQCQESESPHMATAPRITPKWESEQICWNLVREGSKVTICRSFKVFFLKYPISRLDCFAYPILTRVYELHYINTLDEDFIVHFEEKKALIQWEDTSLGRGMVMGLVVLSPPLLPGRWQWWKRCRSRAVRHKSRSPPKDCLWLPRL